MSGVDAEGGNLPALLAERLAPAGFDLLVPFHTRWAEPLPGAPLPRVREGGGLAVLVGNTRALWDPFLAALRADPALLATPHPLDGYTARTLRTAAAELPVRSAVVLATDAPPIAISRLADLCGLGWLSPAYLAVHPVHGPWISLRGVIVLDAPGPHGDPPGPPRPCDACESRCVPALRRALAAGDTVEGAAEAWIAVRDACPLGRASRFGEEQLRYHYEKDRARLARAAHASGA